jgi:hypothetical protein
VAGPSRTTYSHDACGARTREEGPSGTTYYASDARGKLVERENAKLVYLGITERYQARLNVLGRNAMARSVVDQAAGQIAFAFTRIATATE